MRIPALATPKTRFGITLVVSMALHLLVIAPWFFRPLPPAQVIKSQAFTLDLDASDAGPRPLKVREPRLKTAKTPPITEGPLGRKIEDLKNGVEAPISNLEPPLVSAARFNLVPLYPALSQQKGEEGRVLVRLQLGSDSQLAGFEILQSSGHPRLDQAVRQLLISRIQPALDPEHVVRVAFDFELE